MPKPPEAWRPLNVFQPGSFGQSGRFFMAESYHGVSDRPPGLVTAPSREGRAKSQAPPPASATLTRARESCRCPPACPGAAAALLAVLQESGGGCRGGQAEAAGWCVEDKSTLSRSEQSGNWREKG